MALQLRPNCEYCDKDLPPNATEARICSYECTFCADCVENKLSQCLPELRRRFCAAADPACDRSGGQACASTKQTPSDKRVHLKYSVEDVAAHSREAAGIFRRRSAERLRIVIAGAQRRNPDFRAAGEIGLLRRFAPRNDGGRGHSAGEIVPSTSPKPTR